MPTPSSPTRILRFPRRAGKLKRPCVVQPILDLCSQGQLTRATESLELLARKGLRLDSRTLAFLLQQCADSKSLKEGKLVHLHLKLTGLKKPNTDLRRLPIGFNEFSFAGVLIACVKLKELGLTRQAHCQVLIAGFLSNVVLSSSVVDAYAKCGEMCDARRLFDVMTIRDVLAWTTLVSGYAMWGDIQSAIELFDAMPEKSPVSWTALIAGRVFDIMGNKQDCVLWNTMLSALAQHGCGEEAIQMYEDMSVEKVRQLMNARHVKKERAISWIEIENKLHAYTVSDRLHPLNEEIYSVLEQLAGQMEDDT
ncbi:hypothetical protein U1Q18_034739 [Sarracenia purpurea var. burkii]